MLSHSNISSGKCLFIRKKNKQVSLLIRKPWDKIGGKVSYLEDELFVSKAKINIAIFWVLNLCTKIITTSVLLFG